MTLSLYNIIIIFSILHYWLFYVTCNIGFVQQVLFKCNRIYVYNVQVYSYNNDKSYNITAIVI